MQVLAKRDYLVRQRSRGTFVGPKFEGNGSNASLDVVHILMAIDYHLTQTVSTDVFADAFMRCLPGTVMNIQFVPTENAESYAERAVRRMAESDQVEGVVIIRGSRHVQQCIQESKIPAVVYGQVYPGIELSSVKHDQAAVGRLMGEYVIRKGFKRCVLLTRNEWAAWGQPNARFAESNFSGR